jgi:hypothetical protein
MHEQHAVRLVDDDALPGGHDFVFVSSDGGKVGWIFCRRSAFSAATVEESWGAGSALGRPSPARSDDVRHLRSVG